jgi:hypothetical protein
MPVPTEFGQTGLRFWELATTASGQKSTHFLPEAVLPQNVQGAYSIMSQQVSLYADPGSTVTLTARLGESPQTGYASEIEWAISGTLVPTL